MAQGRLVKLTPQELLRKYSDGEMNFKRTYLRGYLGKEAYLANIHTSGSDWRGVRMSGANLNYSNNSGTDFSGIYAPGSKFYLSHSGRAKFDRADLRRADFEEADLTGASFNRAKLSGAEFYCAIIKGMSVAGVPGKIIKDILADACIDWKNLPASARRRLYSIDFHFLEGSPEEKAEQIRESIGEGSCPFEVLETPFYFAGSDLWEEYSDFVEPAENVSQKDIREMTERLARFAGLRLGKR